MMKIHLICPVVESKEIGNNNTIETKGSISLSYMPDCVQLC